MLLALHLRPAGGDARAVRGPPGPLPAPAHEPLGRRPGRGEDRAAGRLPLPVPAGPAALGRRDPGALPGRGGGQHPGHGRRAPEGGARGRGGGGAPGSASAAASGPAPSPACARCSTGSDGPPRPPHRAVRPRDPGRRLGGRVQRAHLAAADPARRSRRPHPLGDPGLRRYPPGVPGGGVAEALDHRPLHAPAGHDRPQAHVLHGAGGHPGDDAGRARLQPRSAAGGRRHPRHRPGLRLPDVGVQRHQRLLPHGGAAVRGGRRHPGGADHGARCSPST